MEVEDLKSLKENEKILILGFGTENKQFLEWLIEVVKVSSKNILIADKNSNLKDNLIDKYEIVTFLGENYLESLKDEKVEFVFKAPGIWSLLPEIVEFRNKKGNDRVNSSLVFFIQKFQNQIIGVTGTKGKSTTSNLITHLINNLDDDSNLKAIYCGNTSGISPYQFWTELDQNIDTHQYYIIELSSFQLEDLGFAKISPKFSVVTNYYIDHLDQHHDVKEYWNSKDNIFKNNPEGFVIATEQILENSPNLENFSNKLFIKPAQVSEISEGLESPLLGEHNQSNVAQSLLMVESILSNSQRLDFLLPKILEKAEIYSSILSNFESLPHRLELIRTFETKINFSNQDKNLKINFYDDGYATEPDAVVAAIQSLTSKPNEFLWLQIAGKDKGSSLKGVVDSIRDNNDKIFRLDLCGKVGQRLFYEWKKRKQNEENFHETVEEMKTYFNTDFKLDFENFLSDYEFLGDNLVLNLVFSPGGSSFDEFNNVTERANWWVKQIKEVYI